MFLMISKFLVTDFVGSIVTNCVGSIVTNGEEFISGFHIIS